MTLIQMEYFAMAARECSFTKAAGKLYVTQQSLSAGIAALERELGCELFTRHVPLELTYAGTELLRHVKQILSDVETARQELCDISAERKGVLRVGIAPTRGRAILPDVISSFRRHYPGIRIEVKEDTNEGLHQSILEGDVDLAVAGFEGKYRGIALREFYREEVMLFAAGGLLESCFGRDMPWVAVELERGNLSALERCPFVLGTPRDIAGRIAQEVLEEAVIRPEIAVRVENLEILLDLCVRGVGCCFCPTVLARTALSEEKFRSLYKFPLGEKGRYSIRFGYRDRGRVWGVLEAFMDIAAGTVGGR